MVKYLRINYPHYNQFLTEYYSEKTRVSTRVNYYPIIINPLCSSMSNIDPITFVTTTTTTSKKKKKRRKTTGREKGSEKAEYGRKKGEMVVENIPKIQ